MEEAQADGDDHENGNHRSEADTGDGSIVVSDQSESDEVSDAGRSEWDDEESADDEEEDADNGHNWLQSRLIHVLQEPAAARIPTASFQLVMTGRALG